MRTLTASLRIVGTVVLTLTIVVTSSYGEVPLRKLREVVVGQTTAVRQLDFAPLADGERFVIVYPTGSEVIQYAVYNRFLDSPDNPILEGSFSEALSEGSPSIGAAPDGGFIIAFPRNTFPEEQYPRIVGYRFDENLNQMGMARLISQYPRDLEFTGIDVIDMNGEYYRGIVTWIQDLRPYQGDDDNAMGRIFDFAIDSWSPSNFINLNSSTGLLSNGTFSDGIYEFIPDVAIRDNNDEFIIAWLVQEPLTEETYSWRYDYSKFSSSTENGLPVGGFDNEQLIQASSAHLDDIKVDSDISDHFAILYHSESDYNIKSRVFGYNSTEPIDEKIINTSTVSSGRNYDIASFRNPGLNDMVAVWRDLDGTYDIKGRLFSLGATGEISFLNNEEVTILDNSEKPNDIHVVTQGDRLIDC